MLLADTLTLESAKKPRLLMGFATFTDSCIQRLCTAYSSAPTNRVRVYRAHHGWRMVWPFPMDKDFDTQLKSELALVTYHLTKGNPT